MNRYVDLALSACIVAVGAFLMVLAQDVRQGNIQDMLGPAGIPLAVAYLLIALSIVVAIPHVLALARGMGSVAVSDGKPDEEGHPSSWLRVFAIWSSVWVYVVLLPRIGYLLATLPTVALGLWLMNERSWRSLLLQSATFTAFTYLLFGQLLNMRLPTGPLPF